MSRAWGSVPVLPMLLASLPLASQPAEGPLRVQSLQMPNGLRVRLLEDHQRPLVRIEFRAAWDPAEVPDDRLPALLGQAYKATAASEPLLKAQEDPFLRLEFHGGARSCAWSLLAASSGQDAAFRALVRAAVHPSMVFDAGLDLAAQADLERFRRRVIRPVNAVLVVYGDMNLDQVRQMCALHLGAWGPGEEARLSALPSIRQADLASRIQIQVGTQGPARLMVVTASPADSDLAWIAARLAQPACAASGLELCAEEDEPWTFGLIGGDAVAGLKKLQRVLDGLRERTWSPEAFEGALLAWKARQTSRALHPELRARDLARAEAEGRNENRAEQQLRASGPKGLQAFLRTLLDPSALKWRALDVAPADAVRIRDDFRP